jgi:hypothetical protein
MSDAVVEGLYKVLVHERNRVHTGLLCGNPTTPSVQLTGAGGFIDWNVDLEGGMVTVNGTAYELAEVADVDMAHGVAVVTNGQSCIAAVIVDDTGVLRVVLGTAAVTANVRPVTDAAITAAVLSALGAGHEWVKIAECTVNRTGDLTLTQSQSNLLRPLLGVTVDVAYGGF